MEKRQKKSLAVEADDRQVKGMLWCLKLTTLGSSTLKLTVWLCIFPQLSNDLKLSSSFVGEISPFLSDKTELSVQQD